MGLYPFFKGIVGKTAEEGRCRLFDDKADAVRLGGKAEYQAGVQKGCIGAGTFAMPPDK